MTDEQRDDLLINISSQMKQLTNDMKDRDVILQNLTNDMKDRDVILQNLSNKVDQMADDMKDRDVMLQNLSNKVDQMADDMKERDKILANMSGQITQMDERLTRVEEKVTEIDEVKADLRNLSRTVAKIEVEHGEKLQILLDVVTGQEEKNKEFEKRFEEDEKILDRHSDQIYYLQLKENKRKPIL